MKKVLITGGSGGLAKAIIKAIESLGSYELYVSCRKKDTDYNLVCDVTDEKQLLSLLDSVDPDLIIHLAATFSSDFNHAYQTNVQSTQHILEYIKKHKKNTRVLLIGSAAEYGLVQMNDNPISEEHVLKPVSVYGITKSWQTQLIGMYCADGVDVLCARIFNLYGENIADRLFAGYLQHQMKAVLAGVQSKIDVGNLSNTRDYISTTDAANQIMGIISLGKSGSIYHVASGIPIVMRDFAIQQLHAYGLDSRVLQEKECFFHTKGFDVSVIFADLSKTKKLLQ